MQRIGSSASLQIYFKSLQYSFVLFNLILGMTKSEAAEIQALLGGQVSRSECTIRITGEIVQGDAEKIQKHIRLETSRIQNYPDPNPDNQYVVCLSGPGGNYQEGIALALAFSELDVTTKVEDGQSCLSACAVSFLGGRLNTRSGEGWRPSRVVMPNAKVGFHAPSLFVPEGDYREDIVLVAYELALDAISDLNSNSKKLYVPPGLIQEIIAHRGDDFYFIDSIDDLVLFDFELQGGRSNPIRADTRKAACHNALNWFVLGDNTRMSDQEWQSVFSDDNSNSLLVSDHPEVYTFFPWDGPVYCHVSKPNNAPKIYPVRVVLSEFGDFADTLLEKWADDRILFRGNRGISSTR